MDEENLRSNEPVNVVELKLIDALYKTGQLSLSFIFEDGVQLTLQYFYFEKYNEIGWFVYFNASVKLALMIYHLYPIGKVLLYELIKSYNCVKTNIKVKLFFNRETRNDIFERFNNTKKLIVFCFVITTLLLVSALPLVRVIGNIFQMQKKNVERACVQLENAKLVAKPFNFGCLQVNNFLLL